ncbi:MAG: FecR domain-containing protein [Alphaproteobacteria bacterium]|nr:FecR domain-containing protein [Alphaproteobacteria bacterium]
MKAAAPGDPAAQEGGASIAGGDALIGNGASDTLEFLDSDFLNDAVRGAEAPSPAPGSDATIVSSLDALAGDDLHLSDLSFVYEGSFVRQGSDLLLVKPDGSAVLIENYFAADPPPDIVGDFGRRLSPELVDSFLMPMAPGQTAALTDEQVAQAQGNSIGTVDTLTGEVYAIRPDGTRVLLQAGDPVFQGDQVETADGGSLKISFIDGTIFTLGSDARLALDEMVYDPGTQSGESAFSILKGGFLFVSGQIAENNPNDMQVSTPVATIGIRGTIVTGEVAGLQTADGETFRFTVVDGEIAVSAGNQTIVLSDNFSTVTATADPSTGQLRVFDFVDTAENVIARNSNQFRALTSNDLSNIERAIETSIQTKTGASVDIDLRGIVDNVTREQESEESGADVEEEGPDAPDSNDPDNSGNDDSDSGDESDDGESAEGGESTEDGDITEEDLAELEDGSDETEEGGGESDDDADEDGDGDGDGTGDVKTGDDDAGTGSAGDGKGGDKGDEGDGGDGGDTGGGDTGGGSDTGLGDVTTGGQSFTDINVEQASDTGETTITQPTGTNTASTEPDTVIVPVLNKPIDTTSPINISDSSFTTSTVDGVEVKSFSNTTTSRNLIVSFSSSDSNFNIATGTGADTVTTGSGADTVNSGAGNDKIETGAGNDVVNAGAGNDTIVGGHGQGNDDYDGGTGTDTLTYDSVTGEFTADLTMEMNGLLGDSTIEDGTASVIDNDTITGIEEVRLGDGNDIIYVNTAGVNVDGDAGTDTISFSSGTITSDATFSFETGIATRDSNSSTFTNVEAVIGGDGDDSFTVSTLLQSASGGSGTDTLSFADFDDGQTFTISTSGIDIFDSTPQGQSEGDIGINARGADYDGFESLIGTDFDDTIHAQNGILSIDGGGGDDRLVVADSAGTMTVSIGLNGDIRNVETLDLSSLTTSVLTVELTAQDVAQATSDGTLHILGAPEATSNIIRPGSGWERDTSLSNEGSVVLTSGSATLILDSNAISAASNGTVTFTGTSDSSWQNSANWSNEFTDDLTPTATDLVVLQNASTLAVSFSGATVTVGSIVGSTDDGTDALTISDGELTVTNGISINNAVQGASDGKLILQGDSSVGTLDLNGGELEITGATVTSGGLLINGNAQTASSVTGTGTLVSTGTVTFADGHDIDISATVDLRDAELVNNLGTNNVSVSDSGRLIIDGDTTYTGENPNGIAVTIGSLGVLEIGEDGTVTLNDGSSPVFSFNDQSTIDLDGVWSNEGTFSALADSATTTISGTGTLINDGELTFSRDNVLTDVENTTAGVMSVTGTAMTTAFSGGLTNAGALEIAAGATLSNSAGFTNSGRLNLSGDLTGVGTLTNTATGTIDGDGGEIAGFVRNLGRAEGSGTITGSFDSTDGTFSLSETSYRFESGSTLTVGDDTSVEGSYGSVQIKNGAQVLVASGETFALPEDSSEGSDSSIQFEGGSTLNLVGDATASGNATAFSDSSSVTITGSGTLTNTGALGLDGDRLEANLDNQGQLVFEDDVTVTGSIVNDSDTTLENDATLTLDGTFTNSSNFTINNGELTGSGDFRNDGVLRVAGSNAVLDDFDLDSTEGDITFSGLNAKLLVSEGSTFTVGADTEISGAGSLQFTTQSKLNLADGERFVFGGISGPTQIQSTEIDMDSGTEITGAGTLVNQSTLDFDGVTLSSLSTLENEGSVTIGTNGLTIRGELDNDGGTLDVASDAAITLDAGGTTTLAGSIELSGGVEIQGQTTLDVLELTGRLTSNGDTTNQDTISANLVVAESGSIVVGGSNGEDGTLLITGDFQNNGFVQVDPNQNVNGVLLIDNDFTNAGKLQVDNAATLVTGDSNDDGTIDGGGTMINSGTLSGFYSGTTETAVLRLGSISNTGAIELPVDGQNGAARMNFVSTHIGSTSGALSIGLGAVLTLTGSTLAVGSGTTYSSEGTLAVGTGSVLDIGSDHGITSTSSGTIELQSGASVGGTGTLVNHDAMSLDGVTINAVLDNATGLSSIGNISVGSGDTLIINGRLLNREAAVLNVDGGTLSGSGTVEHQGTFATNGAKIDDELTFEGTMQISGSGTALTVDGTARGDILVDAATATAIDGDGTLEITGGTIDGAGLRLSTSVDVLQDGTLSFTESTGRISVVGSDWVFGDDAGFGDTNGTLTINGGARAGVAENADFHYDSTSMAHLQLSAGGAAELFGDGTFTVSGGTLAVDDGTLTASINRFVNEATFNIDDTGMSFTGTQFSNTGGFNVLNGDVYFAETLSASNSGTITLDAGDNQGSMVLGGGTFANSGTIAFDSTSGSNNSATLTGLNDANLNNSGTIRFSNEGSATVLHKLETDVSNTGTIAVDGDTRARFGDPESDDDHVLDSRDGTIDVDSNGTLEIRSTLTLGDDSELVGAGTLAFQNGSELNIADGETFSLVEATGGTTGTATVGSPQTTPYSVTKFKPTIEVLSDGRLMTSTVRSGDAFLDISILDPNSGAFVDGHSVGVGQQSQFALTQLTDGTFRLVTENVQATRNRLRLYEFDSELTFVDSSSIGDYTSSTAAFDDLEVLAKSDGGLVIVSQNRSEDEIQLLYVDSGGSITETVTHTSSIMDSGIDAAIFPNGDVVVYFAEDNGSAINRKALFVDADDQTTTLHNLSGGASAPDIPKAVAVLDASTYVEASISSDSGGAQVFIRKAPGQTGGIVPLPDFDSGTFAESIDVTAMNDGGFAVAWSVNTGTDVDVFVQRYNASGEAVGNKINATVAGDGSQSVGATGDQTNVRIDMMGDRDFVVIYESGSGVVKYSKGSFGETTAGVAQADVAFSGTVELTGGGILENETNTDLNSDDFRITDGATLQNSDTLNVLSGTLTNQGQLTNSGTLNVTGTRLDHAGGTISNSGEINLTGSGGNVASFTAVDATIGGLIQLDDDGTGFGALIDLSDNIQGSGHNTLTNQGTIAVNNTGESESADFSIRGFVVNTGTIDINQSLDFGYVEGTNGFTLDTRDGTIEIASGQQLNVRYDNGIIVGSDTSLSGTGTLNLNSNSTLTVASGESFTYDSANSPFLGFNGTVTVDGSDFVNASGSTISIGSNDIVSIATTHFDNDGLLLTESGTLTLATSSFDNTDGTLTILGDSADADLLIQNDMTLGGDIRLDAGDGIFSDADIDTDDNTLTVTGTLLSTSSGSLSADDNDIYGHFINNGMFDIDHDTELEGTTDTLDSRDGDIAIATGKTLEIDGSLTLGADTSLTGNGTLVMDESHLIIAAGETFTHDGATKIEMVDGVLEGSGAFSNYGTVVFDGEALTSTGTLAVNTFTNYGQMTAGGGTLTLATTGFSNATEGTQDNTGTLSLNAGTQGTATVLMDEDFQNAGVLELTGTGSLAHALLTHSAAETLVNNSTGTILVSSSGTAGNRILDVEIDNQGMLDIDVNTTLTAGHTLDSSSGAISLDTAGTLSILGELALGQSSTINSTSSGLIDIQGTLSVAENDTATNEGAVDAIALANGSTLAGLGTFRNAGSLEISGVTLSIANLDNDGTLVADSGTFDLGTTTAIDNAGGTISAVSDGERGVIQISQSAALGGKLLLDVESGFDGSTLSVTGSESLTISGTLQSVENVTLGLDNIAPTHSIVGSIVNAGTFDIDHTTDVSGNINSTNGDFDIASSGGLNITSGYTLTVGDDTDLSGSGTLTIKSGAELEVASGETFALSSSGNLAVESGGRIDGSGTWNNDGDVELTGVALHVSSINNTGTLTGSGGTLNLGTTTNVDNSNGEIVVTNGTLTFETASFDNTNGTVEVAAGSSAAVLDINSTRTLDGTVVLDTVSGGSNRSTLAVQTGESLTIAGTLISSDDASADVEHQATGHVVNTGKIQVSADISFTDRLDSASGDIVVADGKNLSIGGTLAVGQGELSGTGTLNLNSGAVLDIASGGTITIGTPEAYNLGTAVVASVTNGSTETSPDMAALSDGSFWVAYDTDGSLSNQDHIRMFDSNGAATGTVLTVNDGGDFDATGIRIATLGNGKVVAGYIVAGEESVLELEIFNSNGTSTTLTPDSYEALPGKTITSLDLTAFGSGASEGFLMTFVEDGDLKYRRFDSDGNTLGAVQTLESGINSSIAPQSAGLNDGKGVILYADETGASDTILAQVIDTDGSTLSTVTLGTTTETKEVDIAALTNGNFAAAWNDGTNTYVQGFDVNGGTTTALGTIASGSVFDIDVTAGPDGGAHVLVNTGTSHIVYNLDSTGAVLDVETVVPGSGTLTGSGDIVGLSNGSYALAYSTGDIEVHTAQGLSTTANLSGNNNITGAGTLAIASGYSQSIDGVTLSLSGVLNSGTLAVSAGESVTLNGSNLSGSGVLDVASDQSGAGNIVLTDDSTNAAGHTIALSNADTTLSLAGSISTANGSTLVNQGVITASASAGSYALAANIANTGAIILSDSAALSSDVVLDTTDGTLTVRSGEALSVSGNVIVGADTELDGQLNLASAGTLSVADGETFVYDGNDNQGVSFASGGTIAGTGTFNNTDTSFDLTGGEIAGSSHFDNDARVSIGNGEGVIETTNFDNAGGTIALNASEINASTLTVDSALTNAGLISVQLDAGGQLSGMDATLRTTSNGHLTNSGTISVQVGGFGTPGQFNVDIDITNTGLFDIQGDTVLSSNRVLNTRDGTLLVTDGEAATELTLDNATLVVGGDTDLGISGQSSAGTINFGTAGVLNLTNGEDFTYAASAPILDFSSGGSITGSGTMSIAGTLNVGNASIDSAALIDNDGRVIVEDNTLELRPAGFDNDGGTLSINANASAGAVSVVTSGNLGGTVVLDSVGSGNDDATLSVASGQSLTITGTLVSQDSAGSGLSHEVFGTVVSTGLVKVDAELNINDVLDSTDGDISIATSQMIDLDGTLFVGSDTDFEGDGTLFLDDNAVLSIKENENFTYDGDNIVLSFGEGEVSSSSVAITGAGTFTVESDLTLGTDTTVSVSHLINDGETLSVLNSNTLQLSGTTLTNQDDGVLNFGTITGTGSVINNTDMTSDALSIGGTISFTNNGGYDTDGGTIILTGSDASMINGTSGTLTEIGVDAMTIQLNDGATFENQGLISLSDSSGTALEIQNSGSGTGTFANTGTISFGTSSTEIRIEDKTTFSVRAGTTFAGSAGIIALANGGAIAFDTDFTLAASTFSLDSVSEGGTLPQVTGTGTLTNTGGIDNFGFMNINVAGFVNKTTVDAGTSTISTSDFVNDTDGTLEVSSETLTIDGSLTNNGLFQIGSGAVTGSGTFTNAGTLDVVASTADVNADFTGLGSFSNSGTLVLRSAGTGDSATMTVGDFVNTGTISFESSNFTDAAFLKMGASGTGTLTNEGLITNIGARDITIPSDAFSILGNVVSGTNGGTIHVVDYVTSSQGTDGSLAITGNLTLNENSTTIIESGSGSIGGVLNVQGTLTYGGAFELRIDDGLNFQNYFEAVRTGTAVGEPDRIRILDDTGATDFGLNSAGKLVLPNFNNDGNLEFQFLTPSDILQTAGSVIGGTGNETVLGSTGDDVMTTGSSGTSRFYGRGGNDTFTLSATAETTYVDGGIGGRDIIHTDGLSFGSNDAWRINNIEALDFRNGGAGTISMSQEFIYGVSEDINAILTGLAVDDALKDDALIIEGNTGQTLALDQDDWTATGTTVSVDHDDSGSSSSYAIYSASNGAHAYVDTDMQVNLSAAPS